MTAGDVYTRAPQRPVYVDSGRPPHCILVASMAAMDFGLKGRPRPFRKP